MRWSTVKAARLVATGWLVLSACDSTISLGHDEKPADGGGTLDDEDVVSSTTGTSTTGTSTTGSSEERDQTSEGGTQDSGSGNPLEDATSDTLAEGETTLEPTGDEGDHTCRFDPNDGECLNCVKSFCCPEAQSCAHEPGCACMAGCLSGAGMPSACMQTCDPNTESMQLALCIGMSCPGACS